jgi:hypothetical protein
VPDPFPAEITIEEEIPFIEVGGRQTPIEASPSVLAGIPNTERSSNRAQRLTSPTDVRLRGVTFRPYALDPPPLRPATERFGQELVAFHLPDHPISEQYRTLVQDLEKQLSAGQSRALLFTGPTSPGETTMVLLNLAITRARQQGSRNLVVDANVSRPTIAERLGLSASPGLTEVLAGKLSLPGAIQETGQANLFALTAGKSTQESVGLLAGDAMRAVLRQLRARFEWIFVNVPCWDGRPEIITLGSACDGVYLVLPEAEVDQVEELSQQILRDGGCLQGYFLALESPAGPVGS